MTCVCTGRALVYRALANARFQTHALGGKGTAR
jgi:hypothetical protein